MLVDAGGYRVHLYCTGGDTPTVVVVGGAFSFDWALVQPQVARFAHICTYDPSGTAWSDPPPKRDPTCSDRVVELHAVLKNAHVPGPYILVGFSIGGVIARLYARDYPDQVTGMVIVDHAFVPDAQPPPAVPSDSRDSPPVLLYGPPIKFGLEDDENFAKLPQVDQDLHKWAMSRDPVRPDERMLTACNSEIEAATKGVNFPLHSMPLVVISTENTAPGYSTLQTKLLALSRASTQMVSRDSSHMVIIDDPGVVVSAIKHIVSAQR